MGRLPLDNIEEMRAVSGAMTPPPLCSLFDGAFASTVLWLVGYLQGSFHVLSNPRHSPASVEPQGGT